MFKIDRLQPFPCSKPFETASRHDIAIIKKKSVAKDRQQHQTQGNIIHTKAARSFAINSRILGNFNCSYRCLGR